MNPMSVNQSVMQLELCLQDVFFISVPKHSKRITGVLGDPSDCAWEDAMGTVGERLWTLHASLHKQKHHPLMQEELWLSP